MNIFNFQTPVFEEVPILISVPHCGTEFPHEVKSDFHAGLIRQPDDTDWFVDVLYDFATQLGMPLISARYSRWVIDVNRDPESKPLYSDGRIITALCPATTFKGESLYRDGRTSVEQEEVKRRRDLYYDPYHAKITEELSRLRNKFGVVLLWDCHSIRQFVPTVNSEKFPDLILGDADGTSAAPALTNTALNRLGAAGFSLNHNHPFKGGYITRHFGKPAVGQHALQLEMSKINYMDDSELEYHTGRAEKMRTLLIATFNDLITRLKNPASL